MADFTNQFLEDDDQSSTTDSSYIHSTPRRDRGSPGSYPRDSADSPMNDFATPTGTPRDEVRAS